MLNQKLCKISLLSQQLLVRSTLTDGTLLHDDDVINFGQESYSMSHQNSSLS